MSSQKKWFWLWLWTEEEERSETIPSTGKRGAGPDVFWVGRETDDVSKYGVSWEEPDLGERVAARIWHGNMNSSAYTIDNT